jgi:DNA-binding protein HU-beta
MERVGKKQLVAKVAEKTGVNKKVVAQIFDALVEEIVDSLRAGNDVYINGLGTFKPVSKPAAEKRNPQTGGIIKIPPRVVTKFKPSRSVKVLKVG